MVTDRFYQNRVALNVLAKDPANAKAVFEAAEGFAFVGVLSINYPTVKEALSAMKSFDEAVDGAISIGLGAGDNRQAAVVAEIVKKYKGEHINQVFSAVGATRTNLANETSWINSLVSPSGKPGYVNISTGPFSSLHEEQAIVPVKSAIALTKDMGGNALKFFPMNGLAREDELRAVAKACGEEGFALEPTGGIDVNNFEAILKIALEAGVPKVIPHVYSSIIDQTTGETIIKDIEILTEKMKQIVDRYM